MKKLLFLIFIMSFTTSCFIKNPLAKEFCNVQIVGGNDLGFESSVKVENVTKSTIISPGSRESKEYYAQNGDGLYSLVPTHYVDRYVDGLVIYTYPSKAHSVRVFVDSFTDSIEYENEQKISDGYVSLDYVPYKVTIVFQLKEPYIKEPVLNADAYEVRTREELRWISSQSQKGNTFQNKTVKLMNDIDMLNENFTGIAINNTNRKFSGTFDGNNYEVKNVINYRSFIGQLSSTGIVRNLTVNGAMTNGSAEIGGIVGINYGTIESCINNSPIRGYDIVGGIVGQNYGLVKNCINNSSVEAYGYVGGIAGENYKSIEGSINNGLITGEGLFLIPGSITLAGNKSYTGGIVGVNRGSIKGVINNGTIRATNDSGIGQIIGGSIKGHTVENAIENGRIEYL